MIEYIILGILQGIFEWLPVSSEGIVAIVSQAFGMSLNSVDVALFLHLGTLLAVLVYYWKDWLEVLTFQNKRMLTFLLIATIVSLAIGYPLYDAVSDVTTGSILLLVTGLGLMATSFLHKKKGERSVKVDYKKLAWLSGFLQGFAVIPGFSRSGATIFGLSLGNLEASEILKYSYMMSAPVVVASTFYLLLKNPSLASQGWISVAVSFVVGLGTLKLLVKFSKKIDFSRFTFIFGILCLLGALASFLAL